MRKEHCCNWWDTGVYFDLFLEIAGISKSIIDTDFPCGRGSRRCTVWSLPPWPFDFDVLGSAAGPTSAEEAAVEWDGLAVR